ncbi:MAG: YlmC/YmxH family sporulation protein [Ruminococcus sp.]|nr:YlmC/YmxH family sporulation protein [Ruminococcus sp.]
MLCTLDELRRKEVIDVKTGERLGFIDDIELDISDGTAKRLIIYGGSRFFGIFGKEDDVVIRCSDIKVVGREVVLVERSETCIREESPKISEK